MDCIGAMFYPNRAMTWVLLAGCCCLDGWLQGTRCLPGAVPLTLAGWRPFEWPVFGVFSYCRRNLAEIRAGTHAPPAQGSLIRWRRGLTR